MNISTDVHFTLPIKVDNNQGIQKQIRKPLHKIPHCCLGEFVGFEDLFLFAFFPELSLEEGRQTTYLTENQQSLWLDVAVLPALYAEYDGEDGLLEHFPASYEAAKADTLARGTEGIVHNHEMHLSRQQQLRYFI